MLPRDVDRFASDALFPPSAELREAVTVVGDREPVFQQIETTAGPLLVRSWPAGFASLLRIILGQQLSSRAAQAIFQRLIQQVDLTPAGISAAPAPSLKQVGLSRAKIATCQRLAAAIMAGQVNLDQLPSLSDAEAIAHLTQIKGIGVWTAEVYLLFCLERLNSFPASDLAVQAGYQRLQNWEQRPKRPELLAATDHLVPYRGAIAHLLWHYYRHLMRR